MGYDKPPTTNEMLEKLIMHDVACISAGFKGVNESLYYEGLADSIMNTHYRINDKSLLDERKKLGVKVLEVSDDHGYIEEDELEKAVKSNPDFVVYGGDHSPFTVSKVAEAVAEATMDRPIQKYALLGNHDSEYVAKAFEKVGAINIHGKIITTDQGLTIGGMHGSHAYKEDPSRRTLLFQDESMEIARSMIKELQKRDTGLDIFFAHDKALIKAYDSSLFFNDGASHCGLLGNTWLVSYHDIYNGIKPVQYFVHGHLHQEYQKMWRNGQIEMCVYGIKVLDL